MDRLLLSALLAFPAPLAAADRGVTRGSAASEVLVAAGTSPDLGAGTFRSMSFSATVPGLPPSEELRTAQSGAANTRWGALSEELANKHPEIPAAAVRKVFAYLQNNKVSNMRYVGIIDMDKPSNEKRFYIISLADGGVESFLVAHGSGSGSGAEAERFSDKPRSHATSLGIYVTGEEYEGKHGRSLKLEGKESSNDNAESRSVVMHGADYVSDEVAASQGELGNSWGCPAVDHKYRDHIIDRLGGGGVLLIHSGG